VPFWKIATGRCGDAGEGWFACATALFTTFTKRDGLLSDQVFAIHDDREAVPWIGSYNGGLN
jgi:hypothetical protein